jgi:hypothetical protein
MEKMTYDAIEKKLMEGAYTVEIDTHSIPKNYGNGHIFDENKSVKWNREQVRLENEAHNQFWEDIDKRREEKVLALANDLNAALMEEENLTFTQAKKILEMASDDVYGRYAASHRKRVDPAEIFEMAKAFGSLSDSLTLEKENSTETGAIKSSLTELKAARLAERNALTREIDDITTVNDIIERYEELGGQMTERNVSFLKNLSRKTKVRDLPTIIDYFIERVETVVPDNE